MTDAEWEQLRDSWSHLAQAGVHVLRAKHAPPGDLPERFGQSRREGFEHRGYAGPASLAIRCRSVASSRSSVSTARRRRSASLSSPSRFS